MKRNESEKKKDVATSKKEEKKKGERNEDDEKEETEAKRSELSQMHAPGALHNLSTVVLHSFVSLTCPILLDPYSYFILFIVALSSATSPLI